MTVVGFVRFAYRFARFIIQDVYRSICTRRTELQYFFYRYGRNTCYVYTTHGMHSIDRIGVHTFRRRLNIITIHTYKWNIRI